MGINEKKLNYQLRAVVIMLLVSCLQLIYTFYKNRFHFTYGLDDAYIHLAIAKHFAEDGVWGVTKYAFSSATSSPIYTLFLAAIIKIVGNYETIPFILNIIAASLCFYIASDYIYQLKNRLLADIIVLILTMITPIPFLIVSGMEHIFHILAVILLLRAVEREDFQQILLFSLLSVAIRYESMFLVTGLACMFFYTEKKIKLPLFMLMAAFLPVMIWGLIAIQNGAFFFPNPLLMKSTLPSHDIAGLKIFFAQVYEKLKIGMLLNALMAWLACYLMAQKHDISSAKKYMIPVSLLINILIHSVLAGNFIVSRYESYMVFAVLLFTLPYMMEKIISQTSWILSAVMLVAFFPFLIRIFAAIPITNVCAKNIYEQQVQIAYFLKENYPTEKIFAQDIGAIGYYTDLQIYDVMGLSSNEPVKYKRDLQAFRENMRQQPHKFALFWNDVYAKDLQWEYLGKWIIADNMICANKEVMFFAKDSTLASELQNKMKQFSAKHQDLFQAEYSTSD